MSVLTATSIIFGGDSTSLSSRYGITPQNSIAVFYQANAPTGWTRSAAHNDKALRVVSGTGGGSGGVISFLTAFPAGGNRTYPISSGISGSVGGTTVGASGIPSHAHPQGFGDAGRHGWRPGGQGATSVGAAGGNGAHSHPFGGTISATVSVDFRVQYIDVILCSLN